MRYLIIGSGGREHAIYWRLTSDGSADRVFCAPGNGGIPDADKINISQDDFASIEQACVKNKIDMVIVGPEAPLASGLVDYLEEKKIPAFGPSKKAASLEASKIFAKKIMIKYNVPTAGYEEFTDRARLIEYVSSKASYPLVLKLDGLAAGKGVGIFEEKKEALDFIDQMVTDNSKVFAEDFLDGEEASVLGISDGENVFPFVAAQDHKRIFDGDRGPNTGGMGAYAPAPVADDKRIKEITSRVLEPVVRGMKNEGIPFKGILYAGMMMKDNSISVLEFNARFGDPETQVILPLLDGRLGDLFQASVSGGLAPLKFTGKHAITVVLASAGYPGAYEKGKLITGLDSMPEDVMVFHAGTSSSDGRIYTAGGRVLNVTAVGDTLQQARDRVYSSIDRIKFDGCFYRKDIAYRALK